MNEEELKFKYQTIFPTQVKTIDDILKLARLKRTDIDFSLMPKEKTPCIKYPVRSDTATSNSYKILFIDASQFFTTDNSIEINAVEPPLGCISILTYLNHKFGKKIYGEIIKTGVDVESFDELKIYVEKFNPNLIAMRTISYFKKIFF